MDANGRLIMPGFVGETFEQTGLTDEERKKALLAQIPVMDRTEVAFVEAEKFTGYDQVSNHEREAFQKAMDMQVLKASAGNRHERLKAEAIARKDGK